MTQLYTSSRLRVLRQCKRLHHYRYDLGIIMPSTPDMLFGTVGHKALEMYLRAWMARQVEAELWTQSKTEVDGNGDYPADIRLLAALAVIAEHAADLGPFQAAKLLLLVTAYHARWGSEDWEIIAVEQEFRYMLGDHLVGGKIDALICNRKDGRVYVLEHKFTGSETSFGGVYWERLTIDSQVSIYIDGATILGYDVAGCIYDVIKRPSHEQKLATPPDARKYTLGKGCKHCGGSGGGKQGIIQGNGYYTVCFASEVKQVQCAECKGTGWKCDKDGNPQAPRLHADQRDTDETLEEFEERLCNVIAESPDSWLQR